MSRIQQIGIIFIGYMVIYPITSFIAGNINWKNFVNLSGIAHTITITIVIFMTFGNS